MSGVPEGYVRPHFIMREDLKKKLHSHLINNSMGSLSSYIAKAVENQMIRDGIISKDYKNKKQLLT